MNYLHLIDHFIKVLHDKKAHSFIRISIALIITFIITRFNFYFIESYTYDLRLRSIPSSAPSGLISIVSIDPFTIDFFNREIKINDHLQFLKKINKQKPKAIFYLINPAKIKGTLKDQKKFVNLAKKISNLYFLSTDLTLLDEKKILFPYPFNKLNIKFSPITSDNYVFAKDAVTRRALIAYNDKNLFPLIYTNTINTNLKNHQNIRGLLTFSDSKQIFIDFIPKEKFTHVKFESFFSKQNSSSYKSNIKDKIIIFTNDLNINEENYVTTPLSRNILKKMNIGFLQANIFDTLIRNSAPILAHNWLSFIFTYLMAVLTIFVVITVRPSTGIKILIVLTIGFIIFCYISFWLFRLWIDMAHPLLAFFICYYFFIPYRLIVENRKSWEFQEKNKLLTQVEELKSNFIRMMSHDLKTPLARIHGMIELVINEKHLLSNQQINALECAKKSSQDLSHFINSILNFSRMESKRIKLKIQSKDINVLLDEVIKQNTYLAEEKNINIITEYEPLFSIKIDPDLITQVFSNLVENAIKYSLNNSKILITTEESNNKVIIQVSDQGIGISEEDVKNIFMKFFRAKNVKNLGIKGSGLGLYLAKYFVELHNGKINIESSLNQGTTVTVYLPLEPKI